MKKIREYCSVSDGLSLLMTAPITLASIAIVLACAHEPTVGGDGGGGAASSSSVKLTHFQGSGSVSMEVYGIPIEAAVSSDPECSRAIVRIHGVPVLRESLCSPQPAPEASQPESHATPKE